VVAMSRGWPVGAAMCGFGFKGGLNALCACAGGGGETGFRAPGSAVPPVAGSVAAGALTFGWRDVGGKSPGANAAATGASLARDAAAAERAGSHASTPPGGGRGGDAPAA